MEPARDRFRRCVRAYIVSDKTVKEVGKVLNGLAMPSLGSAYEEAEKDYDAAKQALMVVRAEAHRELGVKGNERW